MSTISWPDYVVFASMLILSILIGLYFAYQNRHQSNPEQFLMAGRKMQVLPVSFSILVRWVLCAAPNPRPKRTSMLVPKFGKHSFFGYFLDEKTTPFSTEIADLTFQ